MPYIFDVEGGLCNDPGDPGGLTNFGIDQRSHPNVDIRNLTQDGAKAIYLAAYWRPNHCDDIPWPLCLYYFDSCVNEGSGFAAKTLQTAVGVTPDGAIGPNTLKAIQAKANDDDTTSYFLTLRAKHYVYLAEHGMAQFEDGWLKRTYKMVMYAERNK